MIFFSLKIASPCCGDRAPPCDVGQSHSQNAKDMGNILAKKNLRTAGVSACSFDATINNKHVYHVINTPFVSMHADQLCPWNK